MGEEKKIDDLKANNKVSDEELENVSGGLYSSDPHGKLIVTLGNRCRLFQKHGRGSGTNCYNCAHVDINGSWTLYCQIRTKYNDPCAND